MAAEGQPVIGVVGGSGVYELDGLENARWEKVESPFGAPSDELLFGELDGQKLVRGLAEGTVDPAPFGPGKSLDAVDAAAADDADHRRPGLFGHDRSPPFRSVLALGFT